MTDGALSTGTQRRQLYLVGQQASRRTGAPSHLPAPSTHASTRALTRGLGLGGQCLVDGVGGHGLGRRQRHAACRGLLARERIRVHDGHLPAVDVHHSADRQVTQAQHAAALAGDLVPPHQRALHQARVGLGRLCHLQAACGRGKRGANRGVGTTAHETSTSSATRPPTAASYHPPGSTAAPPCVHARPPAASRAPARGRSQSSAAPAVNVGTSVYLHYTSCTIASSRCAGQPSHLLVQRYVAGHKGRRRLGCGCVCRWDAPLLERLLQRRQRRGLIRLAQLHRHRDAIGEAQGLLLGVVGGVLYGEGGSVERVCSSGGRARRLRGGGWRQGEGALARATNCDSGSHAITQEGASRQQGSVRGGRESSWPTLPSTASSRAGGHCIPESAGAWGWPWRAPGLPGASRRKAGWGALGGPLGRWKRAHRRKDAQS